MRPATAPPPKTPADIAAAVAAKSEELRRESHREDVARWRVIVGSIADGHEPDGHGLAEIAEIAARLKLAEGALAKHVEAVTLDRKLADEVKKAELANDAAEIRGPLLAKELEEAQRRLNDLRVEAESIMWRGADVGNYRRRVLDERAAHPLLWADLDAVVGGLIEQDTGRAIR